MFVFDRPLRRSYKPLKFTILKIKLQPSIVVENVLNEMYLVPKLKNGTKTDCHRKSLSFHLLTAPGTLQPNEQKAILEVYPPT